MSGGRDKHPRESTVIHCKGNSLSGIRNEGHHSTVCGSVQPMKSAHSKKKTEQYEREKTTLTDKNGMNNTKEPY